MVAAITVNHPAAEGSWLDCEYLERCVTASKAAPSARLKSGCSGARAVLSPMAGPGLSIRGGSCQLGARTGDVGSVVVVGVSISCFRLS